MLLDIKKSIILRKIESCVKKKECILKYDYIYKSLNRFNFDTHLDDYSILILIHNQLPEIL